MSEYFAINNFFLHFIFIFLVLSVFLSISIYLLIGGWVARQRREGFFSENMLLFTPPLEEINFNLAFN